MGIPRTPAAIAVGTALTMGAAIFSTATLPAVAAADPMTAAVCALSGYGLKQLVKNASEIRFAGAFEAVALGIAGDSCTSAMHNLTSGKPATLNISTPKRQLAPQTVYFDDLVTTLPPDPGPPPPISGPLGRALDEAYVDYEAQKVACSGYKLRAFFDACMNGELEPVYQ